MSSRCRSLLLVVLVATACSQREPARKTVASANVASTDVSKSRVLRVCSDPNNLPFSNERQQGFENRIANLIAADLGAKVEYTWWAQRRGFIRSTLKANTCDVIMGVPTSMDMVLTTRPYYRSTYVFVSRHDRHLGVHSFDDAVLRKVKIGVHMIGDDGANTPPAHALTNRGIINNVAGYMIYGDYREESPPSRMIEAVAKGDVDVAVAWGPLAGYYANRQSAALDIVPVSPQIDLPYLPFVFDISMGVRRTDTALRDELDAVLARRHDEIEGILDEYRVPRPGGTPTHRS